jgi:hypothetical protein
VKRFVLFALVVAGCKSGVGDRCQVNADCQDGLVCNQAKNTCQGKQGVGGIDAAVPDGPKPDAPPDAKVFMDAPTGVAP